MRHKRGDLVLLGLALALLVALTVLRQAAAGPSISRPSTYDTGRYGYAALYELLAREGVPVERFTAPAVEIGSRSHTLVVAGDRALQRAAPREPQLRALDAWVRGGGTLILLGSAAPEELQELDAPALRPIAPLAFARAGCAVVPSLAALRVRGIFDAAMPLQCHADRSVLLQRGKDALGILYRRGRGSVIFIPSPSPFENVELTRDGNAAFAFALFAGRGPVAFDERIFGYGSGRTFWEVLPLPARTAVLIACAVLLIAIAGANLPFAPPYAAPEPEVRDSRAYIASLARMLQRGEAARETIAIFERHADTILRARSTGDERARELLERLRALAALPHPRTRDLLAAGKIVASIRKTYEW